MEATTLRDLSVYTYMESSPSPRLFHWTQSYFFQQKEAHKSK
jgi:hypothetical protein